MAAFMAQQTQITGELKGMVEALQAKQTLLKESLAAQSRNKGSKADASVDEEIDMEPPPERFEDPQRLEQGRGRGKGSAYNTLNGDRQKINSSIGFGRGKTPIAWGQGGGGRGTGRGPDSWRTGEPQPFRHDWETFKEGSGHNRCGDNDNIKRLHDDYEEGSHRGNRVPRFTKMEFPTYDGKGEPMEWLQKCEDFFEDQQNPSDAWFRQVTFALQGRDSGWYRNLRRMKDRLNWVEFAEECKIRFGPPMSLNPLGELCRLRQQGTVEDYCEIFESHLSRTTGVWHFCAGLTTAIRYEVEYMRPTSLYYSMNLARQIELKVTVEGKTRSFGGITTTANRSTTGNRNRDRGAAGSSSQNRDTRNPAWKRLTSTEMADRHAKGLCFNCDEMFSIGHKCAKLFCIMMADDEEDEISDETLDDTPKYH
ncbi:hypothetical protein LXL04_024799 [Taraxacum kok-saghyz]